VSAAESHEGGASADIEARVVRALDDLGVAYERMPVDPAFADTAAFCERYGFPIDRTANTILCASRGAQKRYAACVVLATTRLDVNHTVRRLMGVSRLSFANAEETSALTGMMIGGVTPFGLADDLPIYVDERVMALDYVLLGGGSRSMKVKTSPEIFSRLPKAQIITDLAIEAGDSKELGSGL
jgi:prolyl-tRNA editing enzyme YbaK/EbsC (Cys-tRNA(Pro) deacylase)